MVFNAFFLIRALQYFLAGSICACLSHVGGVPIDVLKTRLQTDPGRCACAPPMCLPSKPYEALTLPMWFARYEGLWDAAWKVTRTEGPGMLLQGLGPTAAGYAIQGGLKYGLYELFKAYLSSAPTGDTAHTAAAAALPLAPLLAAAACAELIASTALCPYEAARIRLVAEPSFASGLGGTLARLVRDKGLHGVFGCAAAHVADLTRVCSALAQSACAMR